MLFTIFGHLFLPNMVIRAQTPKKSVFFKNYYFYQKLLTNTLLTRAQPPSRDDFEGNYGQKRVFGLFGLKTPQKGQPTPLNVLPVTLDPLSTIKPLGMLSQIVYLLKHFLLKQFLQQTDGWRQRNDNFYFRVEENH